MASQVAAHVTLIYPQEIPSPVELERVAASAAACGTLPGWCWRGGSGWCDQDRPLGQSMVRLGPVDGAAVLVPARVSEQGRSVLWTQALNLRSDLTLLAEKAPGLVRRPGNWTCGDAAQGRF